MNLLRLSAMIVALFLVCCSTLNPLPKTEGEKNSGFTYIPLDLLPVITLPGIACEYSGSIFDTTLHPGFAYAALLKALPDNAVRIAVKEYDIKGNLSYAGSSVGTEGKRYQVILDYINVDSSNIRFYIKTKRTDVPGPKGLEILDVNRIDIFSEAPRVPDDASPLEKERALGNIVIPVYVGVGLRLTADLQVLSGKLNLSSLGAIAAGVEAGKASGSLVVQTLGVTGKQVSTSLPLPSELNQTTVQNAILSLGSIKAIIFDVENTTTTPRVTGIYLPIRDGNEDLVNRIVSELARHPIPWYRPCVKTKPGSESHNRAFFPSAVAA